MFQGLNGFGGLKGEPGDLLQGGVTRGARGDPGFPGAIGANGFPGRPGRPGNNGRRGYIGEQVRCIAQQFYYLTITEFTVLFSSYFLMPQGDDGRPGLPGQDGIPGTPGKQVFGAPEGEKGDQGLQ